MVWYDTRNAANNIDSQLFYSYSTDAGVTWAANIAVSNSFNPQAGFPQNEKIGDYITIVSDATGGNVAYAATFNVNPNAVGGHEQDVYYVRVSPSGGGTPTPTPTASPTRHGDCYRHRDSNAYGYTDSNSYAYGNSDSYSATYAYAQICPNTEAPSHTSAETIELFSHQLATAACQRCVRLVGNVLEQRGSASCGQSNSTRRGSVSLASHAIRASGRRAVERFQISILLPKIGRISLDNFAVLD